MPMLRVLTRGQMTQPRRKTARAVSYNKPQDHKLRAGSRIMAATVPSQHSPSKSLPHTDNCPGLSVQGLGCISGLYRDNIRLHRDYVFRVKLHYGYVVDALVSFKERGT